MIPRFFRGGKNCRQIVANSKVDETGRRTRGRKSHVRAQDAGAGSADHARRASIAAALRRILPGEGVLDGDIALRPYESDGLTAYRQPPLLVVLPETTAEVAAILKYCHGEGIKVVPRGAGTSLSGGALPLADGVLMSMMKFNRILDVDFPNRCAVVQPGVTNLGITRAVEHAGFYYAPDPSSQIACSIGGNVAENSGGVHCLKYGLTTNNVLGLEMVLMTGEVIRLGGRHLDAEGYDLLGLVVGSEGLLGVVTEVTVRLLRSPETARALLVGFASSEEAGQTVADVVAAGIIPGGMEMMDRPAIAAAEDFVHVGYPRDAEALLIVELDGPPVEVDHLIGEVEAIALRNGATSLKISGSDAERMAFWAGRKAAFPAVGRISPDYYCMDGTIPRKALPQVLAGMRELSVKYGLSCANVFHAGDGNLHPLILYDANKPGELQAAEDFGSDILRLCVKVGGVLTGEHGVGVEKRDLMHEMFDDVDLAHQMRVKCAFDDGHLLNPGKVFPQLRRCAELGRMHIHRGNLPFPELPRF
ncbi:putative FAD-linked oxidoreductase [Methylobrevis pamukkalensis]|uniref:Putative FAD-linked oxidoreductase n=1 Tax=Methylobrevis pamukkalensis TaxID=1439726 RepID=A0A1E3H6E1_9HYPH|nr:putative FAD-linked oxidoreductase [Methylobrevis pamukkalensis]